jgi:ATP-dependent Lon protease
MREIPMSDAAKSVALPPDVVALVPMRNVVLFPHALVPIAVGRPKSVAALLASLFTGRPVRHDLAMTGEISLRGLVLPVGGIKEKLLAAQRAGLAGVLLPARNEKDLHDVPASVTQGLRITWLHGVDNAVAAALAPVVPARDAVT